MEKIETCPKCNSPTREIKAKDGSGKIIGYGCTNSTYDKATNTWLGCNWVVWENASKFPTWEANTDKKCPKCGSACLTKVVSNGQKKIKCSRAKWDNSLGKWTGGCEYYEDFKE